MATLISQPGNPQPRRARNKQRQFHDVGHKGEKDKDTWQLRGTSSVSLPLFSGLTAIMSQMPLRRI